jgi:hypothetical protein
MDTIVVGKKEWISSSIRRPTSTAMRIAGVTDDAEAACDRMGISASACRTTSGNSPTRRCELHHTERIHGSPLIFTMCFQNGLHRKFVKDELKDQRLALMQADLSRTFSGFTAYCSQNTADSIQDRQFGDMLSGVVHLEEAEAKELYDMIRAFLAKHEQTGKSGAAWEYALIAYPITGADHA